MELNGTGEVRRNGRVVQAAAPTGRRSAASGLSAHSRNKADQVALSSQVLGVLEENNRRIMEQKQEEGSTQEEQCLKLLDKGLKTLNKCQKIYARVVNGDKVPPEDLLYLQKNDPEGFKLALAMRKPNKHPKEWESVLDDEDRTALASNEQATPLSEMKPTNSLG